MREINIAKVIATKRKEKGVTQDELAEYIGVSKGAVSKWENAQSYPDITILPQLAAYFNISIDELIGYFPQMMKEDIKKTYQRLAVEFGHLPFDEVLAECRVIIKKYFSCFPLLLRMAVLLLNHYMLEKDKEKQEALLQEIVDLCVRIKLESDDVWIAKQANSIEAYCYLLLKKPNEILELIDGTIKPFLSDDLIFANAYQMLGNIEKAKSVLQISMYYHLRGFLEAAPSYLMMVADQPEQFEQAGERFMHLSEIFEMEKLDPNLMCQLYFAAAQGYTIQNNFENALKMLESYSNICTTSLLPYKLEGDTFFYSIEEWLKDYNVEAPRDEKTVKIGVFESVAENPAFSDLHDKPRYKRIIQKLSEFAEGKMAKRSENNKHG